MRKTRRLGNTVEARQRLRLPAVGAERRRLAPLERDCAEGLLVDGETLDGYLPEDKARSVHGVDPETVLRFKVEKHGEEYWTVGGKKL